jgi:hypothetical protein
MEQSGGKGRLQLTRKGTVQEEEDKLGKIQAARDES